MDRPLSARPEVSDAATRPRPHRPRPRADPGRPASTTRTPGTTDTAATGTHRRADRRRPRADARGRRPGRARPGRPLGSPEPGAPDLDGAVGPGGVSGPPGRTSPRAPPARRPAAEPTSRATGASAEDDVPYGLRTAAAWSWRLIVVIAGFYVLLYAAAYIAVVVVPVIVALLLAALLQPGAAGLVRRGWPRSLAAFAMLLVGLAVVAGIITLVVERFIAGFTDLADAGQRGHRAGADLRRPHLPDHPGPARGRGGPAAGDPGRQPGHPRLRARSPPPRPSARCSPASSWRCSRSSSSSRTAGRSGCGWSACSRATPAPTSTRPPAGRGGR